MTLLLEDRKVRFVVSIELKACKEDQSARKTAIKGLK